MDTFKLAQDYLAQKRVMQLATQTADGHLWACSVHYYCDESLNLYWVSNENREHSKHIAADPEVAVAIVVHEDTPDEKYIIGLSMSGVAEAMDQADGALAAKYIAKLQKDPALVEKMQSSTSQDKFYKFTPSHIVLIDSQKFPDNPRQELIL